MYKDDLKFGLICLSVLIGTAVIYYIIGTIF
jgi:hypothetical protein